MRNMSLTMREDIEQESNDHHPVRWHWRVGGLTVKLAPGSLQLSDPSPATSSQPAPPAAAPPAAAAAPAAAPARTDADRMGLAHKVGQTEACTPIKFSRFLFSHLIAGSRFYWSLAGVFGRNIYPKKKKKSFCSAISQSDSPQPPSVAFGLVRSSTVVWPQLRWGRRDYVAHLVLDWPLKWLNVLVGCEHVSCWGGGYWLQHKV